MISVESLVKRYGEFTALNGIDCQIGSGSFLDCWVLRVVASITDKKITSDLAKRTLRKAIDSQAGIDLKKLILHSDQGSQYTSKEFTEFCEELGITQSMSKAAYPYDNAPI